MVFEYLEKAWKAYTKNIWKFILAIIILYVIMGILMIIGIIPLFYLGYTGGLSETLPTNLAFLGFAIIMFIIAIVVSVVLGAGIIKMAEEALKGKTKVKTMFTTAKKKFWSLIGAAILVLIITGIIFLIFLSPVFLYFGTLSLTDMGTGIEPVLGIAGGILLMFILMIPAILLTLFFQFVFQSVVIDNKRAIESIRHSIAVVKQCYFQLLGLVILFILISIPFMIIPYLGTILLVLLISPLQMISYTALYLSNRKIKKKRKKRR